jgi:hypothetical protein
VRRWYDVGTKEVECLYRYDKVRKDLPDSDQLKLRGHDRPRQAAKELTGNLEFQTFYNKKWFLYYSDITYFFNAFREETNTENKTSIYLQYLDN